MLPRFAIWLPHAVCDMLHLQSMFALYKSATAVCAHAVCATFQLALGLLTFIKTAQLSHAAAHVLFSKSCVHVVRYLQYLEWSVRCS